MAWDFDPDLVVEEIISMINVVVGTDVSFLLNADGTTSTVRSIIFGEQTGPEPELPFITVTFAGSSDEEGFLLDQGLVQITDPNDAQLLIWVPYYDKILDYGVTIRCEGEQSHRILSKLRKNLILPKVKQGLKDNVHSVLVQSTSVKSTPDLLATEYRRIHSFLMRLSTVDRLTETLTTGYFDTIRYTTVNDPARSLEIFNNWEFELSIELYSEIGRVTSDRTESRSRTVTAPTT